MTKPSSLQDFIWEDQNYRGSTYREVKDAIFADPYYDVWKNNYSFPYYDVTSWSLLRGVISWQPWHFLRAAKRTLDSKADLRWGPDLRGHRRLVHPNGVCLTGFWEMDDNEDHPYTGYFARGKKARVIGRYSTGTRVNQGRKRSLSLVGKLYPLDEDKRVVPANFITQDDLGGRLVETINDAELRNAPDTTIWNRGSKFATLLVTGVAFMIADIEVANRQVYEIAEAGLEEGETPVTPQFMRLIVDPSQPRIDSQKDFRNEVMAHIFDSENKEPQRELKFRVEVSDTGRTVGPAILQRRRIPKSSWRKLGTITFDNAVVSYTGDFVIHFHHPAWRHDRNDPNTIARPRAR